MVRCTLRSRSVAMNPLIRRRNIGTGHVSRAPPLFLAFRYVAIFGELFSTSKGTCCAPRRRGLDGEV